MALHPLLIQDLSLARQEHLRREAEAVRSIQTDDNDHPARIRWIRRYVTVEETRCCPETTSW